MIPHSESCVFHFSHFELYFALHSCVSSTFQQHLLQFPIIIFLFQSSAGEFLAASNFMIGQMPDVQSISEIVFQLGTTVVIQMKSYLQLV